MTAGKKNNFEIIGSILFYIVGLFKIDPIHKKIRHELNLLIEIKRTRLNRYIIDFYVHY